MIPSFQPLNFNADLSPQEEATMSVSAGVEKYFSSVIRDAAKAKREEDKAVDEFFQKTIESTDARFQDQLITTALQTRNDLKEKSRGGWNSPEARSAKNEAMMRLSALSSKANQVVKYAGGILNNIDKMQHTDIDGAKSEVSRILNSNLENINLRDLDEIVTGDKYTDWESKAGEAINFHIGPAVNVTRPIVTSKNGVNVVGHYEYKNNFRQSVDTNGNPVFDKATGEPVFENVLEKDDAIESILLRMSGDRTDWKTDLPVAYRWLDDIYASTNPQGYKATLTDPAKRKEALHNVFRAVIQRRQENPKYVDDRVLGQPSDPRAMAILKSQLSAGNNPELIDYNNKKQSVDAATRALISGDVSVLNNILQSSNKVKGSAVAQWAASESDGIYTMVGDNKPRAMSRGQLMVILGKETYAKYFNADGTLTTEGRAKYEPYTGIYWKESGTSSRPSAFRIYPIKNFEHGRFNPDIANAVSAIVDYAWDKGDIPQEGNSTPPPAKATKKQIKASEIKAKAQAAGQTESDYRAILKKNNVEILENQ